jgi:predicted nucleotidyltransferase
MRDEVALCARPASTRPRDMSVQYRIGSTFPRNSMERPNMIKNRPIETDVSKYLPAAKKYFEGRADVVFACLFGSHATGKQTRLSDLDIAVYLTENDSGEKTLEILGDLNDIFKTDEIDLVILNKASLPLRYNILKSRKVLADNEPFKRHIYESMTIRSYFDFAILEDRLLERK